MPLEIERKFLVKTDDFKKEASKKTRVTQGYLSSNPERTVRVRIKGNEGFITVKGKANRSGICRYEWEKEISIEEAEELLKICESGIIDKTRYEIEAGKYTFEVDEFYGDNQGLIVAEIELNNENDYFEKPQWLGKEVTGNTKYYNSMLVKNPYKSWKGVKN